MDIFANILMREMLMNEWTWALPESQRGEKEELSPSWGQRQGTRQNEWEADSQVMDGNAEKKKKVKEAVENGD